MDGEKTESLEPKAVSLVIELSETGGVVVEGPLTNKLLCYGMLEAARDIIREYQHPTEVADK